MNRTRLLLIAVLLGVPLGAYLVSSRAGKRGRQAQAPLASADADEVTGPVVLASAPVAPMASPALGSRWWFEMTMRRASPEIRSARLEAAWWSRWPASPLEAPEAVFASAETDLRHGDARVQVLGDANPGWVVLFVVCGGRRTLADPWSLDPRVQVEAGRGWGDSHTSSGRVVPLQVGAVELVLRAVDRDGAPVEDLEVDARVSRGGRLQRRRTDAAGRARFTSFPAREAVVSWRQAEGRTSRVGEETLAKEFPDGSPRLVAWGEDAESVVRIPRSPRLRLRVRIAGAPEDAWCPASYVRVDHAPGVGHTWEGALGFFLPVGTWTCRTEVFGAGEVSATAQDLALEDDVVVDVPAELAPGTPWLDVRLSGDGGRPEPRPASAIEARRTDSTGEWRGVRASAPSPRILLPLPVGEYVLGGAQRRIAGVGISDPLPLSVAAGDRRSVVLETASAAGLVVLPTDIMVWNDKLGLLEGELPGSGVVEDDPFRFTPFFNLNRERTTTLWVRAGPWRLVRFADRGPWPRWHLAFDAKPGRVLRVRERAEGFSIEGN